MQTFSPPASHALSPQASSPSDFLLVCEARSTNLDDGRWHFALETADGCPVLEAGDVECGDLNRLTLLAAVRGLEAIEGPASVTLVSNNRYLIRSLTDSLPRWRSNNFVWEHFGRRIVIQNADLWKRVDRALQIHRVEACLMTSRLISAGQVQVDFDQRTGNSNQPLSKATWRVDPSHSVSTKPHIAQRQSKDTSKSVAEVAGQDRLRSWLLSGGASSSAGHGHRFSAIELLDTN